MIAKQKVVGKSNHIEWFRHIIKNNFPYPFPDRYVQFKVGNFKPLVLSSMTIVRRDFVPTILNNFWMCFHSYKPKLV